MGVVLIPDMGSNQLSITVTVPADTEKEEAFATADAVMDAIAGIDGVETVGAMSGGSDSTSNMLMMSGTEGTADNTSFTYYVLLTDEGAGNSKAIQQQIAENTADLNCEVNISASSMDMSALSGSGIEVDIYGRELDDLTTASQQVMELLNSVDGIENVSNGQEAGDEEVHIVINKDKAMRLGLTVAQVYQQIAAKLSTNTTATTLKVGSETYTVTIVDKTDAPNLDDLFQMNSMAPMSIPRWGPRRSAACFSVRFPPDDQLLDVAAREVRTLVSSVGVLTANCLTTCPEKASISLRSSRSLRLKPWAMW